MTNLQECAPRKRLKKRHWNKNKAKRAKKINYYNDIWANFKNRNLDDFEVYRDNGQVGEFGASIYDGQYLTKDQQNIYNVAVRAKHTKSLETVFLLNKLNAY